LRKSREGRIEMSSEKHVDEPARRTPVLTETDVLVVGGGPAGLSAAVSSARMGARTILMERYGCLGGNITLSQVEALTWYRHPDTVEAGGIGVEFENRMKELGGAQTVKLGWIGTCVDADIFKYMADQIVKDSGVIPLYHSMAVSVLMEGQEIRGIIAESKSGRNAILAKRVIDCTGDADLAFHAEAPYEKGDEAGRLMGGGMVFGASGVNTDRLMEFANQHPEMLSPYTLAGISEPFRRAAENGEWPYKSRGRSHVMWHTLTASGEATGLNMGSMFEVDGTDVWQLTRAEIEGREQAMRAIEVLRKYQPGFENCRLRTTAMSVGLRETRRITGDYLLSKDDIMNQARFDDSIGIFPVFYDGLGTIVLPDTGAYLQVPYRILLPQNVENLLVAGRCVSSQRDAIPTTRQMMCCSLTGQAAGTAAALSVRDSRSPREVGIDKLQKAIRDQGVRIE
jgi:hypothetical protein